MSPYVLGDEKQKATLADIPPPLFVVFGLSVVGIYLLLRTLKKG